MGSRIAFLYARNKIITKDYAYAFRMKDGSIIQVLKFKYQDNDYNISLANEKTLRRYGIKVSQLFLVLSIMKEGYCVYRYIDNTDGIVKYIGITKDMYSRYKQHENDKLKGHNWRVDFIDGLSKTDAEILESHFISQYKTYKFYNKAKVADGISKYLIIPEEEWRYYYPSNRYNYIDNA